MTMFSLVPRLVALLLVMALFPLLVLLALACALTQGRPVMFRQMRAGKGTKPFELLKFRSMSDTRDKENRPLPDDQRMTVFGKFLRRSRLDELPGLLNVVRGEMALVGPRPLLPETIDGLGERGRKRCAVRPGLTGWSQVNGNTLLSLDQKIALDLWYIEHRNAMLDLRIIASTLMVMIAGERFRADRI